VVKDASSDSDHRPALDDTLGRESDDEHVRSPVGNLTQELTQLLAASIAQKQASSDRAGAPPNDELTSLADLVSTAAAQRTIAPASKDDGLSTLSHNQPGPFFAPLPMAPAPLDLGHDDEPMPIPSTWLQPQAQEDDRWFRRQVGSAVLGLIAGLMIVVPAVLWLTQKSGPATASRGAPSAADARAAPEAKVVDVKTVRMPVRPMDPVRLLQKPLESAAQFVTASVEQPGPAAIEVKPPQVPVIATERLIDRNKARIDELLAQVALRIDSGDITGAREMLEGADVGRQGVASFALAETYDPNMLAAWGTRGVTADATKARALYQKAFDLGVAQAEQRLDALR